MGSPNFEFDEESLIRSLGLSDQEINQTAPSDLGLSGGRNQQQVSPQEAFRGEQQIDPMELVLQQDAARPGIARAAPSFRSHQLSRQSRANDISANRRKDFEFKIEQAIKISGIANKLPEDKRDSFLQKMKPSIEQSMPDSFSIIETMSKDPKKLQALIDDVIKNPTVKNLMDAQMEVDPTGKESMDFLKKRYDIDDEAKSSKGGDKAKAKFARDTQVHDNLAKKAGFVNEKGAISSSGELLSNETATLSQDLQVKGGMGKSKADKVAYKTVFDKAIKEGRITAVEGSDDFFGLGTGTTILNYESAETAISSKETQRIIREFSEDKDDDDLPNDLTDDDDENEVYDEDTPSNKPETIPTDAAGKIDAKSLKKGKAYVLKNNAVVVWNGDRFIPVGK